MACSCVKKNILPTALTWMTSMTWAWEGHMVDKRGDTCHNGDGIHVDKMGIHTYNITIGRWNSSW